MDHTLQRSTAHAAIHATTSAMIADEEPRLPDHLARLPDPQWAIWRWVGLRSAGFPIDHLLALGAPQWAAAVDRYLELEAAAQQAQERALEALREILDAPPPEQRDPVVRAIQSLKKGQPPKLAVPPAAASAVAAFCELQAEAQAALAEVERAVRLATAHAARAIRSIAHDPAFREALIWQNRHALQTGVDALLRQSPDTPVRSSKYRQHEALVVSYIQRYCAKNDTIGFFGPVGWAYARDEGPAATMRPGAQLLAARTVYFDGWGIDALAEILANDESLHPWLAPRRLPHVFVDGTTLHLPLVPPARIPALQAAVLAACDGVRTAKELATDLVNDPTTGVTNSADVYKILKKLCALNRIVWTLEVPAEGLYPEQSLRQQLQRIEDDQLRLRSLQALAELETARTAVADARGDVARLEQAMERLESTFTRLTGVPATRRAGTTYAGRTLVYEDCRRDIEVTFGPALIASLGEALAPIFTSARWFTYRAASLYRQAFTALYWDLTQKVGSQTVDFASFWLWAHPVIFGEVTQPIEALEREFQSRWADILAIPEGQRHVVYASREIQRNAAAAFEAPSRGWAAARYHSPDVMIAAPSIEAIRSGQYQAVLGELHPAANTLKTALFVGQHPAPEELFQAVAADFPDPNVVLVASRESGGPTLRLSGALMSPHDLRLVFAHDSCGLDPEHALPISALVIEAVDQTLMVRTRDGRLCFEIIELLGELLMIRLLHHFSMIRRATYTPRISFDSLVICRESWRFRPEDLLFGLDETERLLAVRRWVRAFDLPRFVFITTPTEKKPFYVDFESPASIDLFAKAVRRAAEAHPAEACIKVTEMLPDPSQTWLADHEGRRYTCELRIVAVDMA
ncbi:MAG TPA: lantibiotic dehydratase [Herpetosiphonaceae bacterium]